MRISHNKHGKPSDQLLVAEADQHFVKELFLFQGGPQFSEMVGISLSRRKRLSDGVNDVRDSVIQLGDYSFGEPGLDEIVCEEHYAVGGAGCQDERN